MKLVSVCTTVGWREFLQVCLVLAFVVAPSNGMSANRLTLEELVREVKVALLKVQQDKQSESLQELESVVLEVNAVQAKKADGKISLMVVEIGGGVSQETTHTLTLTLTPPRSDAASSVASVRLADSLAESILVGARAIAVAKKGSPPLLARTLEATIKFALQSDAGGGLKITFPPFGVGAGASISAAAVQTIKVTYQYPKP